MATRKKAPAKKAPRKKAPGKSPARKPTRKPAAPKRAAKKAPARRITDAEIDRIWSRAPAKKAAAPRAKSKKAAAPRVPQERALSQSDVAFLRKLRAGPEQRVASQSVMREILPEAPARNVRLKNLDTPSAQSKFLKRAGSFTPWVLVIIGGSIWWLSSRASAASAPPLLPAPQPTPPQQPPSIVNPPPPAAPVLTSAQRIAIEFRRVKPSERIPRDILTLAQEHIHKPIGAIIFQTSAIDGKEYAYVLEQHANIPKGDGGVSVYVKR